MHILVDITHPAHVHFYRHAIRLWRERGHRVVITARRKDIAVELLERYGFNYVDMGATRSGMHGLAVELVTRNTKLFRFVWRQRPDVLTAIGGIFAAQVGWLARIPSVIFTDTENATLSNLLTFPFASVICTPTCYEASVPAGKHVAYPGYQELAYTYPNRFCPDPEVLSLFGIKPDDHYIVMRLVSWGAAHDLRDRGFSHIVDAVRLLERYGQVLISAESALPETLHTNRVTGPPEFVHHLLYYARLFIGESATMVSESAMLGTPAIFVSTSTRGYTNEQGIKYDLVYTFSDPVSRQQQALDKAVEILSDPKAKEKWRAKRDQMLADKIDVTQFIVDVVERYGLKHQRRSRCDG